MQSIDSIEHPIGVPEDPSELGAMFAAIWAVVNPEIEKRIQDFMSSPDPVAFEALERRLLRTVGFAVSHMLAGVVELLGHDSRWCEQAKWEARASSSSPLRDRGARKTCVRFLSGAVLWIRTPYFAVDRRGRSRKRRGASGSGAYPYLLALGIRWRASAGLVSEAAQLSARMGFERAQHELERHGCSIDVKSVRDLAKKVSTEAITQRSARTFGADGTEQSDEFAAIHLLVGTDGGRSQIRAGGKRGRKGKKGRRKYRPEWREPKMMVIYSLGPDGRCSSGMQPVYDGTFGDADQLFAILIAELMLRGAARAASITVVADGAAWIWNRVDAMAAMLGWDSKKITRVVDFYHAVEHLGDIAASKPNWSKDEQRRWVKKQRKRLLKGKVDLVIEEAHRLAQGRGARAMRKEIRYFETRREFMKYDEYRANGIPRGSGATESAVRRVVNMRLKGAGIFWNADTAEGILHTRSYLLAGRWDELMARVLYRTHDGRPRARSPDFTASRAA